MSDRAAAERACKDPNPIIDGRKANVNLAYLGAKPRGITTATAGLCEFFFILVYYRSISLYLKISVQFREHMLLASKSIQMHTILAHQQGRSVKVIFFAVHAFNVPRIDPARMLGKLSFL